MQVRYCKLTCWKPEVCWFNFDEERHHTSVTRRLFIKRRLENQFGAGSHYSCASLIGPFYLCPNIQMCPESSHIVLLASREFSDYNLMMSRALDQQWSHYACTSFDGPLYLWSNLQMCSEKKPYRVTCMPRV
jgi:hypothetical protein